MFENVGSKIKKIAKLLFAIGVVLSVLLFIIMLILAIPSIDYGDGALGIILLLIGIFSLIIGPIISWLSVLLLYAFGEMVEKTVSIENSVCDNSDTICDDIKDSNTDSTIKNRKTEIDTSVKKCKYCGKKVPLTTERCECGCIAFEDVI